MTKTKKMGLALMLLMFPAAKTLFAQSPGEIRGKVLEKKGVGALGVMIWVDVNGEKFKTMTDDEGSGNYLIKPLEPGTYIMYVKVEMDTFKKEVVVSPNNTTYMPDIDLSTEEYTLNTLKEHTITFYQDPLIDKSGGGTMTIVRAKELVHSPAKHDIKQIISTTGGVQVNEKGDAYVRGSRADATVYFIDGVKLRDGFRSPPANAIASLSVYTGGVPAKYGDCTGGVIVVETQSYFTLYNEWVAKQNSKK
jgi:TonB-dependent Receptor Plug Domain